MRSWMAACVAVVLAGACSGGTPEDEVSGPKRDARSNTPEPEGYGPARSSGRIKDPLVTESSGIVASTEVPGTYWTHNDSGGEPALFCLRQNGRSCGSVQVPNAEIVDWEDIARGPGPEPGESYFYIGDIGDNGEDREFVVVYRVPEPGPGDTTVGADEIGLRYPDGPHDAEVLLVHPDSGDLYIVTKGDAIVYTARAPLASDTTLERVGRSQTAGILPGPTGGDIAPDGSRAVFSTYTDAYELVLSGGRFDSIWRTDPIDISLPGVEQREAIAYDLDGTSILITSEGVHAPIYRARRAR